MAVGDITPYGAVRYEAKASLKSYLLEAVLPAVVGVAIAVPFVLFVRNPDDPGGTAILVLTLPFLLIAAVLTWGFARQKAYFQVTDTHVVKRRMFRGPIAVLRREIAEAVVAKDYDVPRMRGPRVFLVDRTTRTMLSSTPLTDLDAVEALAWAAPRVTRLAVLEPRQAAARWPNMLPWSHREPIKFGLVVTGGIILAILAIVLVISA